MSEQSREEKTNDVRRKLLKAAMYMPPVILGTMIATPRNAMGAVTSCNLQGGGTVMVTISSGTNACCPCVQGAATYNVSKCETEKCIVGCGAPPCDPAVLSTIRCSDFCPTCGGTAAGSTCVLNTKSGKWSCTL